MKPTPLHGPAPDDDDLVAEALAGLRQSPPALPSKLLYDQRGSELFERICELPEYYPTRTEMAIMRRDADEMAAAIGDHALLIELGSGSSTKTRILLDHLPTLVGYVPIDISREHLRRSAHAIAERYPHLEVMPLGADYSRPLELPNPTRPPARRMIYFPGSTIGNFPETETRAFLQRMAALAGPGGGMLVGVDLRKSPEVLIPAYNDAQGVTAAFNLNMLHRLNREAGADFDVNAFEHRALWNEAEGRIEMHLVATRRQDVTLAGERFRFEAGESIHTESSYKHTLEHFAQLAEPFEIQRVWMDDDEMFSVQYMVVNRERE